MVLLQIFIRNPQVSWGENQADITIQQNTLLFLVLYYQCHKQLLNKILSLSVLSRDVI